MIKSIELVDFLSHSDTKLQFDDDTTVFVGQNGAGTVSYTHLTLPTKA